MVGAKSTEEAADVITFPLGIFSGYRMRNGTPAKQHNKNEMRSVLLFSKQQES